MENLPEKPEPITERFVEVPVEKRQTPHYLRNRDTWIRELADCHFVKPLSVRVGVHLAMRMNIKTRDAWPSINTIAKSINASQRGVISALDELKEEGFLGMERRRNRGNRYWLRFKWE